MMTDDALSPSDDTHRIFFEHNPLPMYLHDTATLRFVQVNDAAIAHYGYSREEFLSMQLTDIRPTEEHDRLKQNVRDPWSGDADAGVWIHRKKSGALIHVLIHFVQFERNGRTVRLVVVNDVTQQIAMEKKLRESEERFRIVVENVPDFIIMFDRNARLTFINRVLPGYKMEDVLGRSSLDFVDPKYHQTQLDALRVVFEKGESFTYEIYASGIPGQMRWYMNRITPLMEKGVTIEAIQISTDITVRREAEEALRASEARFRAVLEGIPGTILLIDREHRIRFVNAPHRGMRTEDIVGKYADDFVAKNWRQQHRELVSRTIDNRESGSMELLIDLGPAGERWFEIRTMPLVQGSGEVQALVIAIDIHGRKRAESQLRERKEFIERFASTAPYVIYVFDIASMTAEWMNHHVARDLGYSPEEIEALGNLTPATMMHPEDVAQLPAFFARWATTPDGTVLQTEYRLKHKDGSWHSFLDRDAVYSRDSSGRVKQLIGSMEDITSRKQLEEQLRQSQKLDSIGRLAGGIAHDFNNLLTSILGHVEMAQQHLTPESRAIADLEVIRLAAERSAELTNQLLSFARKQIIQPRLVNLNEMMQEAQRLLLRVLGENIEMLAVPFPTLGLAKIDPGQMTQVLINLAVNARDAMPAGGRLVIESGHAAIDARQATEELVAGDYITLSVSDTGTGMSSDVLRHIFEPFYTTKGVGRGTGLGLATCYGIIKQALGHITVKTQVGKGSTFTIYLPRADSAPVAAPIIPRLTGSGGTETVLVVEDDDMLRSLATRFLSAQGYTVLAAANGFAALDVAKAHGSEIQLLLTDIVMPRMKGTQLAAQLAAARPGLRVIFMSGYTEEDLTGFDSTMGPTAVMNKPFSLPVLGTTVRGLLDRKV